jgi:hypothetical protein
MTSGSLETTFDGVLVVAFPTESLAESLHPVDRKAAVNRNDTIHALAGEATIARPVSTIKV